MEGAAAGRGDEPASTQARAAALVGFRLRDRSRLARLLAEEPRDGAEDPIQALFVRLLCGPLGRLVLAAWRTALSVAVTDERTAAARVALAVYSRPAAPAAEIRRIAANSIEYGWRVPSVKYLMLAAPFTGGVGIYVLYALQPHLLNLYGDSQAYGIADLVAAIVAGAQILGGVLTPDLRKLFRRRTSALLAAEGLGAGAVILIGLFANFWAVLALIVVWGLLFSAAMPIRQAYLNGMIPSEAGHDPLVRLVDELERRDRRAARARPDPRRLGLSGVLPRRGRTLRARPAVRPWCPSHVDRPVGSRLTAEQALRDRKQDPTSFVGAPAHRGGTGLRRCWSRPASSRSRCNSSATGSTTNVATPAPRRSARLVCRARSVRQPRRS